MFQKWEEPNTIKGLLVAIFQESVWSVGSLLVFLGLDIGIARIHVNLLWIYIYFFFVTVYIFAWESLWHQNKHPGLKIVLHHH